MSQKKLLFVCMGNSCNSPMAETIMQHLMNKTSLYWEIDSAALRTWNIGRKPHKHCLHVLKEHGLHTDHFTRLLTVNDFHYFDLIIAMNEHIHKELLIWAKANHVPITNSLVLVLNNYAQPGKAVTMDLSPICKLRNFRAAYYHIKECCKQLILSLHARIVRYDLPSSDEDEDEFGDEYAATVQMETSESPANVSLQSNVGQKQKLCVHCGEKFLATL